ncbi:hypothetical protein GW17_00048373 [Ensete ventricosum]|nr:hypothetical protein GW17_00048373 [Ensete ventricosum]
MGTIVARGLRGWRRLAGGDDSRARERGQHAGEDSGRIGMYRAVRGLTARGTTRTGRYVPVRQLIGMQTACYWVVPPKEENLDLEISSPDSLLARDFFSPHEEKERGDGRQEILELYLQDKPLADDIDVNLTAYHESGHAIVALNTDCAHAIHKATIIPRGSALGMVTQLPLQDETSISKRQLLARLDVCMGGRVAEELIFGEESITSGASSDLQTATELAHYMVLFFGLSIIVLVFFSIVLLSISAVWQVSTCGMSDAIGPVSVKERPGSELQSRIDAEVCFLY